MVAYGNHKALSWCDHLLYRFLQRSGDCASELLISSTPTFGPGGAAGAARPSAISIRKIGDRPRPKNHSESARLFTDADRRRTSAFAVPLSRSGRLLPRNLSGGIVNPSINRENARCVMVQMCRSAIVRATLRFADSNVARSASDYTIRGHPAKKGTGPR